MLFKKIITRMCSACGRGRGWVVAALTWEQPVFLLISGTEVK